MALQGDRLYIGGFFNAVNNVPRSRVALVNKDTGALDPTFNPNADGDVRTLAISPDQSRLYVGGSFLNIAGAAQAELVALDPITGIRQPIVFQQFVGAPLELDVDPSGTRLYAALSGFPGGGNRAVAWNTSTGVRLWRNEAMGDTQAIEYDAGYVYFGFHEGYGGDLTARMLAADATSGALDPNFRPTVNSFFGVWSIDSGNDTLAVGGEFTNFNGRQVQGLALLPSLYANDHDPADRPCEPQQPEPHRDLGLALVERLDRQHPADRLRGAAQRTAGRLFDHHDVHRHRPHAGDCVHVPGAGRRRRGQPLGRDRARSPSPTPLPFVSAGANWRYLDNGTDQGTAWRASAFNDSAWASGPAQLGYGDGDEATVVGFGPNPNQRYRTTYFRRTLQRRQPGGGAGAEPAPAA